MVNVLKIWERFSGKDNVIIANLFRALMITWVGLNRGKGGEKGAGGVIRMSHNHIR